MEQVEILSGNELIIQGGLEAGFSLYTGYPGSPLADYFNILSKRREEFKQRGIKVVIANSEANAAAMASGAKQVGRDCLIAMKSMGLHVASDALSVGNFSNPGQELPHKSGVVIVVGDDPWSQSTSTPADSRYLFKHLHIPFLEPATPQELKDWMKIALGLSRSTSVYQGLLLTTAMAEGGGRIQTGKACAVSPEKEKVNSNKFDLSETVMVPPNSLKADQTMIKERFPKVEMAMGELNLDKIEGDCDCPIGIISSGVTFETVKQVLEEENTLEKFSLYKLASSFPLIKKNLLPWLQKRTSLIVVEEKRGFLETELKEFCHQHEISIPIFGKKFKDQEGFPAYGGLDFDIIKDKLNNASDLLGHSLRSSPVKNFSPLKEIFRRLPTFCPGCPHRETLSLLKDLRKKLKEKNIDLISHGDVGCYSLSFLPPFKEMHNLSAMGQGGALGSGMDIFTKNPSVILMGDSTFFHSGITDISHSVQMGHNILYILLENDNTAMTGHQATPTTGQNVAGESRPRQDILEAVRGLGVSDVLEINPSDRYFYYSCLIDYIEKPGVKVIVSRKECALTFHGRKKTEQRELFKKGWTLPKKTFYQINTDACEDCRACVESTGCPGLTFSLGAYGRKVSIDPQICVGDSYCTKIKACPSFERVDVYHYHPTKWRKNRTLPLDALAKLPLPNPKTSFDKIAKGSRFRAVITGVGGSGVTTISRLLAEAANHMGGRSDLDFKFFDQKGLAQRNGHVTGHVAIFAKGTSCDFVTSRGKADLLLSPDLLDGAQHVDLLSPSGLAIMDNTFQAPLELMLSDKREETPFECLGSQLKENLGDNIQMLPLKKIAELAFGNSLYASTILLGATFQADALPFSLEDMHKSIERTFKGSDQETNRLAFGLGRYTWTQYLAGKGEALLSSLGHQGEASPLSLFEQSIGESLLPWQRKRPIIALYQENLKKLKQIFSDLDESHLAQYLHDLYIYDRGKCIQDFLKYAESINELYPDKDLKAVALRTLVKTFFIKDEIFVSHIMISPVKELREKEFYTKLGSAYKIFYINRPSFDIMGKTLAFDFHPKKWMLRIMRHMRVLRKILSSWHSREKKISLSIRQEITNGLGSLKYEEKAKRLNELDNIKGYREVRYEKAGRSLHTA